MTEMSRLWPAESQGPYAWWAHTAHDNAQGRAPSPDPLRKGVDAPGRPRWVQEHWWTQSCQLSLELHTDVGRCRQVAVRGYLGHVFSTGKAVSFCDGVQRCWDYQDMGSSSLEKAGQRQEGSEK